MEPTVYRISAVLAGQSAHVAVVGRDAAGRELQLELSPDRARGLQPGQLLLLTWSAHVVPELEAAAPAGAGEAKPSEVPDAAAPTSTPEPATARSQASDEEEVFRMLGLG
ncbi:hypothetical protein SAMN02745121_08214 [Nannocystis exedens]|uniref:TOBE domain-containing protein n=1 Tax=Nannocystis exedens TaxID=54 RepID=A0A1I2HTL1_9BACT|nr:hypothetical protein [Nannocystis exedens]PCC73191.1 hypothetical protein NAEX_06279 [Nannocystis exedens]SFF33394.1 hypothetical protein SAMN02745121_08214 [Nannocystis exedens]